MIKELRRKFILINMILVFLVLAVVFTALCISNFQTLRHESYSSLRMMLNRNEEQPPPKMEIGKKPPDDFMSSPVFVLKIMSDGSGDLIYSDNITISEEEIAEIVEALSQSPEPQGVLTQYNLRYLRHDEGGKAKVAFMELTYEKEQLRNTIVTSIASIVASLVAFFFVSMFLAKWALRPVEQAWRQQRQFVADASHELKTPLTVILANTGIMKSHPDETVRQQMNWVDNTEAEAKRMRRLVDELLFLAKTDNQQETPIYTIVNLSDTVFSSALAFESVAYERGVSMDMDITPDLLIQGDLAQIKQLVGVLLDNAIKYSPDKGAVTVTLRIRQGRAVLKVNNTGSLISDEEAGHLFERFYRAEKSRTREGYGLGLSIAKSITDSHNGDIYVRSSGEDGTTFTVTFPLSTD